MITAAQIRARRAALKWTQEQLATKVKVHKNTIVKIEKDNEGPETMRGHNIIAIARALGLDDGTGELLDMEEG